MAEIKKSLNTIEAAKYLQENYGIRVTPGTMEVWRCYGRGPRYRKVSRWIVYPRADLDMFANGRLVETVDSREARHA